MRFAMISIWGFHDARERRLEEHRTAATCTHGLAARHLPLDGHYVRDGGVPRSVHAAPVLPGRAVHALPLVLHGRVRALARARALLRPRDDAPLLGHALRHA